MANGLRGALMVCGTTSNAGKTTLVTGLARVLARRGVRVAPFKAQNMALNSVVTLAGHEIGRAQGVQAVAAGVEPEAAMNPILLKPTGERTSQVVVMGRPHAVMTATEYHAHKPELLPLVLDALADLRSRFDVVLCEGAGSPAEINLLDHDIVNLRIAHDSGMPAIVVGDIDLGGVFASLYGTVALLPEHYRALVRGFVINKLRGDPALLLDGCAQLRDRTGLPTFGVLPWIDGADLDPLAAEPGVTVRFVGDAAALGTPDLVVLPGTKATVADLAWLRERGLADAIRRTDATVLGVCGGYQMLGEAIHDDVESDAGAVAGLGLLPVSTTFAPEKVTRRVSGTALRHPVAGYRIHHGRVVPEGGDAFVEVDGQVDGVAVGTVYGTTVHGLLETDGFRAAFLGAVAARAGKRFVAGTTPFAAVREARIDRLADVLEAHLDLDAVTSLVAEAAHTAPSSAPAGKRS